MYHLFSTVGDNSCARNEWDVAYFGIIVFLGRRLRHSTDLFVVRISHILISTSHKNTII